MSKFSLFRLCLNCEICTSNVDSLVCFSRKLNIFLVSGIMGSMNAPVDFRHHFENYSYKPFGIVVKGGEENS